MSDITTRYIQGTSSDQSLYFKSSFSIDILIWKHDINGNDVNKWVYGANHMLLNNYKKSKHTLF